jgi:hypothetical protein
VTAFAQPFLFLRDPDGNVENCSGMYNAGFLFNAGFRGVFCNIHDYAPSEWERAVVPNARAMGMAVGPWARTMDDWGNFWAAEVDNLVDCAREWGGPLIVNSESEIKGSGADITQLIADKVAGLDAAISSESYPFLNVDWTPVAHLPALPQIFPEAGDVDLDHCLRAWHDVGVRCVYFTYASYGGRTPADYDLRAPYSIYTADDCLGAYDPWRPTSSDFDGCVENGGDVPIIGTQDGIQAAINRLIELDPGGTKPNRDPNDLATWGAWDKLLRTLQILKDDHDAQ